MVIAINPEGSPDEDYLAALRSRAERLVEELELTNQRISQLVTQRETLGTELGHLSALLGADDAPLEQRPYSEDLDEGEENVADLVVELLRQFKQPLHYREIERELRSRSRIEIAGQNPANTLLAKYFKDKRLYRPARGTYGLREWDPTAKSVGTRRSPKRRRRTAKS